MCEHVCVCVYARGLRACLHACAGTASVRAIPQAQLNESQAALAECKAALDAGTADLAKWEAGVGLRRMHALQVRAHQLGEGRSFGRFRFGLALI